MAPINDFILDATWACPLCGKESDFSLEMHVASLVRIGIMEFPRELEGIGRQALFEHLAVCAASSKDKAAVMAPNPTESHGLPPENH